VIKTLIISFNYPPTIGGIETYAKELNKFFFDKKDINFYFPSKIKSPKAFLRGISLFIFILKAVFQTVPKKYDVIHMTSFNLWLFAYLYSKFNKNTKFIINIWGLEFVYGNKLGILPRIYKKFFINMSVLNSSNFYYMVSSKASKRLLIDNGFRAEKIRFIKLGISKNRILTKSIELNPDNKYFLFVGRIVERKGLSWFVKNILPYFSNYKLKVVGPIGDKKEFSESKNPMVEYLGVVSDDELSKLRREAALCVVPNIYLENDDDFEAFCFVTIESVSEGSLVVASNYQGIPEALLNGNLGYLAEPSDIESWKDNISLALGLTAKERKDLVKERSEMLKKELSWDKLFNETYKLYSEVYVSE
tara:strand:+ start:939 stop:2024 length:1086 start_codon:yes stop_codon:yes gene_type:complete